MTAQDGHPADPDILLEVSGLHTHFYTPAGVVKAVDGVDLTIPRGKTVCVVGESGCGKSVMARSILQVVDRPGKIVSGQVRFHPESGQTIDITALSPRGRDMRAIRGKDITMIFQEPMSALSPLYTIGNQIMEVIRWHLPLSKQEARMLAIDSLRRVGIPRASELIDSYTFELSGGMRQRAMIAMALVCEPRLLIADEPTTALDVTTQANILDLIRNLQQQMGTSVMFITHDLGVVAEIADEVAVMYLGQIVEYGSVHDVFADPKHPYTRALLRSIPRLSARRRARLDAIHGMVPHPLSRPTGCAFHTRCEFAQSGLCDVQAPALYDVGAGHAARCLIYREDRPISLDAVRVEADRAESFEPRESVASNAQALLEVRDLKMHFPITAGFFNRVVGHVRAVDGVSFAIYEGETLGLVGESGCGKTTLGHTIMRLYAPTSGEIRYSDSKGDVVNLEALAQRDLTRYHREIRMVFQDPFASLNPRLPVLEIVGEVLQVAGIARGRALEAIVTELLERVGLRPEYVRRYPHAFSGGERQRIGIARALAPSPRLVVADEPVSALDVSVQAQILNLLKSLQASYGLTYLFIAHDLSVVAHISDRVAVMYVGRIVEVADADELFKNPRHPYTEALLSSVPTPDPRLRNRNNRIRLEGEVADPANPPAGCAFHPRCRYAQDRCRSEVPQLRVTPAHQTQAEHLVACHLADELDLAGVLRGDEDTPAS